MTSLSFVSYAVNGAGVGHLSRQIAIQKWMRRLCAVCGVKSQHWFLTTSEADTALFREGFAGFKLPSKTVVDEAGIDKLAYLALAKQWVWHSLALLKPDVFLVDTFPNGSFHELVTALDLCRHAALVYRPVKEDLAVRDDFKATARLYDRVIVPVDDVAEGDAALSVLDVDRSKATITGPIMRVERFELLDRERARARFGAVDTDRIVVVTAGGGGDANVKRVLESALRARTKLESEREVRVHLVLAAGPLYRGDVVTGARTTWFQTPDLAEHLLGVDACVSAAGFNSAHETSFAGVPTLFVPQGKIADDQLARAQRAANHATCAIASLDDEAGFARAFASIVDAPRFDAPIRNCARDAAVAALSLALPESDVKRARDALDDASLAVCARLDAPLGDVVDLATALWDRADVANALAVLERTEALSIARPLTLKIANALSRKARLKDGAEGLGVCFELLVTSSSTYQQWSALPLLLQALPSERLLPANVLVRELVAFLERASDAGLDVFASTRLLHECATELGDPTSSQPVLALASRRVRERAA